MAKMVNNVQDNFVENAQTFANWLHLVLYRNNNFYEIAIVGDNYKRLGKEVAQHYIPNSVLVGSEKDGPIELLKNRYSEGETLAYVCIEGTCKLPVSTSSGVLEQIESFEQN
mgnify:FL=1